MKHCPRCNAEISDDLRDCGKHDNRATPTGAREISSTAPITPVAGKRLVQVPEKVEERPIRVSTVASNIGNDLNTQTEF